MTDRDPTLESLAELSRFVVWANEMRDGSPKITKVPYNPRRPKKRAMANNPAT